MLLKLIAAAKDSWACLGMEYSLLIIQVGLIYDVTNEEGLLQIWIYEFQGLEKWRRAKYEIIPPLKVCK